MVLNGRTILCVMIPGIYLSETDNRKRQINTLKVFNDNVSEVAEGSEYKLAFIAGGNEFDIHVTLSNNFPQDKPSIKISPVVVHPWVDSEGEVTSAPGLLNFTIHSDLGRVVQAIIREFERNPPPLITDCNTNNINANIPLSRTATSSIMPMPVATSLPQMFPDLNKLSLEELQFLNENTDRQQEFIEDVPQIKEQNRALDELIDNIEDIADSNLSMQERIDELKKDIDTRLEQVTKLALENERLYDIYSSLSMKYAPRNIQEQLKLAAQKAEFESEKAAEAFLNGEIDVENFISLYTKTRSLCQTRKTKEENLDQQLDNLERAGY